MKGMTLIETLIYITLLSLLLLGVFSSIYSIIYTERETATWVEDDSVLINTLIYER